MPARLLAATGRAENAAEYVRAVQVSVPATAVLWFIGFLSAVLFLPAGPFMVAVRCCTCPPSAAPALTLCPQAQVPTAENLDSARSNVNNFAILGPGLRWARRIAALAVSNRNRPA
jgi:hypothetical protein